MCSTFRIAEEVNVLCILILASRRILRGLLNVSVKSINGSSIVDNESSVQAFFLLNKRKNVLEDRRAKEKQ